MRTPDPHARRSRARLAVVLPALLVAACGGSASGSSENDSQLAPTDVGVVDAVVHPAADVDPGSDAAVPDGGAPDAAAIPDAAPVPDAVLGPVQAVTEPTPLPVERWLVTTVGNDDPVLADVQSGSFRMPAVGRDFRGQTWTEVAPDENGGLGGFPPAVIYAATTIDVPAATTLIARADLGVAVYVGGAPQPGDVYGSGRMRVPVHLQAGSNVIVVRAVGGRGNPSVQFWTSPDELAFNLADVTSGDLPIGSTRSQFVGVPVLNLSETLATSVRAEVVEDDLFAATELRLPALPGGAVTKLAFELRPKGPIAGEAGTVHTVHLRVSSTDLQKRYEQTLDVPLVDETTTHRESFRSKIDGSAQYYGLVPPAGYAPAAAAPGAYGMVLTLHGAGVEGIGQAQAYSAKDWTFIAAATNRRPFGFDWEEWGRLDALEVLESAQQTFATDPTQVYLTGHSMGGHGTWQVGVHNPGRFAVLGPSAGWSSFYSYSGETRPTGPFGRARASSDTNEYLVNLTYRGVYVIHGSADDNVPVSEARNMLTALEPYTSDVQYHEEPGAGHWWDGDAAPGADCVDWPPLFDFMKAHRLDPFELDFIFKTPGPFITPHHSFITLRSAETADRDCEVRSSKRGDVVVLTLDNVRSYDLNGDALIAAGITDVDINGVPTPVTAGVMEMGPRTGKHPGVQGPMNEVYQRPFCYVYSERSPKYAQFAAYQLAYWAIIGNGQACALPLAAVTEGLRHDYNLVYLGARPEELNGVPDGLRWDDLHVYAGADTYFRAAVAYVFPDGARLSAVLSPPTGGEDLLYAIEPFSSRSGLPDYLIYNTRHGLAAGFFDPEWQSPLAAP